MARSYITGMGVTKQKENIPWEEIKDGDVLFNYGNTFEATVLFVHSITNDTMNYQLVQ